MDYDSSYRSGLDPRSGRDMACGSSLKWGCYRDFRHGEDALNIKGRGHAGKEYMVRFDVL